MIRQASTLPFRRFFKKLAMQGTARRVLRGVKMPGRRILDETLKRRDLAAM